jgi:hypothetical protein
VKERRNVSGGRIDPRQVLPLPEIASVAGQSKVSQFLGSTMLFGHDVFNVVRDVAVFLMQPAVLAAVLCAPPHKRPRRLIHRYARFELRCLRALLLRIEIKSAALISASYSACSSLESRPSLARSAKASTRS